MLIERDGRQSMKPNVVGHKADPSPINLARNDEGLEIADGCLLSADGFYINHNASTSTTTCVRGIFSRTT